MIQVCPHVRLLKVEDFGNSFLAHLVLLVSLNQAVNLAGELADSLPHDSFQVLAVFDVPLLLHGFLLIIIELFVVRV